MFSQRRMRTLIIAAIALVFVIFYYSGEAGTVQNQPFYRSTVAAIEAYKNGKEAAPQKPQPAIPLSDTKVEKIVPEIPKANSEDMEEISIAGRIAIPKNRNDAPKQEQEPAQAAAPDHSEAKAELDEILKKAPVIIFSKSYCPYSKRAKSILLEHYTIVPAPYVVELDHHVLGKELQAVLAENTGRRTVPNVLVNGKSIGGGDDVTALDAQDELASTLKNLGGKWIQEVNRKEPDNQPQ